MSRTKKAYEGYYKGLKTAIGGPERFNWYGDVFLSNIKDKTILDLGCGEGSLLKILEGQGNKVFGIDASKTAQILCKEKGIDCILLDISTELFPYNDNTFDIVLCLATLEHVENPCHCIYEVKRVLKEKGTFIASIPNPKNLHPLLYPGLFDVKNFKRFLTLNCFEIINIKGWGQTMMLHRLYVWLGQKNKILAKFLYYLTRKRNWLMRKHIGTPLTYCFMYIFVCLNYGMDKTLTEEVAEGTYPGL